MGTEEGKGMDRRGFLKLAGLGALGAAALPAGWTLLKPGEALAVTTAAAPGGVRWAMVVDMRKSCPDDCRSCVGACNKEHNIPTFADEANPKLHELKWLWKTPYHNAFPGNEQQYGREDLEHKQVMVLCNHCVNPPCVKVCPTQATYQRPDGIVMMDFHRCIGCRYCMAGCPYGSRSFNWKDPRPFIKKINLEFPTRTKGVVEKCNFCEERLVQGLLPACVEACKEKALVFGDLKQPESEIRKTLQNKTVYQRQPGLGTKPKVYYVL
jgi:Fe-S-cluster-containing dehydrogenase component